MANQSFEIDVFRDLLEEAGVISQLIKDEKAFGAAYEAFRTGNSEEFHSILQRLRLLPYCRLVCEWFRSKECIFLCLELCGPPKQVDKPNPRDLATAIVRITSNDSIVKELGQVLEKRDSKTFQKIVEEYKLGPICHLFCHWLCVVRYRLFCKWVCSGEKIEKPDLVHELQSAGEAMRQLLEHKDAFDQAVAASKEGDAKKLGSIIQESGLFTFCHFLCEWFCSWRCTLACLTLCREFPLQGIQNQIQEALAFAKALVPLSQNLAEFERLSVAIGAGDVKTYNSILQQFKLQPYCIQLCHWVCGLRCYRFCILVCPPPDTTPLFTHVGEYHVDPMYGDFQADGTTTAGGYAFTSTIPLIGNLPGWESTNLYEYRFRIAKYPGPAAAQDVDATMIKPTVIGQLAFFYYYAGGAMPAGWYPSSTEYYANNPGATFAIPQQFPPGSKKVVSVNTDVQAGGWIRVPHENDYTSGGGGRFLPQGGLVDLDTTKFTNESFDFSAPAPGLTAGDSIPTGIPPHSEKPIYKIFFEARKQGTTTNVSANNLDKIAFSNTAYTYIRHNEWDGGQVTTRSMCSLNIAEMIAPGATGCDNQHDHVHGIYTCYHPYLGSVLLWLQGPGIPTGVGIPPSPVPPAPFSFVPTVLPPTDPTHPDEAASGPAGHDFDISLLGPCAYILWMCATVKLTAGWGLISDATDWDVMAFCKR
jgi:hypothetical protein